MFVKPTSKNDSGQLSAFLDNLPVALCRTSVTGKLIYANTAFKRLLGYRADADLHERDVNQWYRHPAIRRNILNENQALVHGTSLSVDLISAGGEIVPCRLEARGVYDDHGILSGLDEAWLGGTQSVPETAGSKSGSEPRSAAGSAFILTLDLKGRIIDLQGGTLEHIDFNPEVLRGRLVTDVVRMENPHLMDLFLAGIQDNENAQGIISIVDRHGRERQINFAARLVKTSGQGRWIEFEVRDPLFPGRPDDLDQAKFDGVREMAGGIAHRLNQPLMVLNNRIGELLNTTRSQPKLHSKLVKVREILAEINDIARKIGGINKYASMDYVGGIKIVDIDQSSTEGEN